MAHKMLMFTRRVLASAFLAALLPSLGCNSPPTQSEVTRAREEAAADTKDAMLATTLELEDRRSDGNGVLQRLALEYDPQVRLRAVRALGRMPFPEHGAAVTVALKRALSDPDPVIRAQAAFGMGLRHDPASRAALSDHWKDGSPLVRARLVEAASRFQDFALREEVLYCLSDPSPLVRAEAAIAPMRWESDSSAAAVVDSALANVLAKAPASLRMERWGLEEHVARSVVPEDFEVIWRALSTLARRKSQRGRDVFYLWCHASQSVRARIFATRGLANLTTADEKVIDALRTCLLDEDWRVVVEAVRGLGNFHEPNSSPALERALGHPSAHVRREVAAALGAFGEQRRLVRPILEKCLVDVSPGVQASAIISLARLYPNESAMDLETRALSPSVQVRWAAAEACEFLATGSALQLLDKLSRDNERIVAINAVEGYGHFLADGGRESARSFLSADDNGLRLAGVLALANDPSASDLPSLLTCYKSSTGDIADELRYEILNIAGELNGDGAYEVLMEGRRSLRVYTRALADELLRKNYPSAAGESAPPIPPRRGELPDVLPSSRNPRVEVITRRGRMVFELFPEVAPMHTYNFLELARRKAYDGLDFHRVVPNFVVQGGDYRGDGNGGVSWRTEPLRHEFNEKKFVRGSLGMPRNADPDSGGSQWFVTHLPTPHLDGRYTLFGQLLQGFDVLDALEQGDRILSVRVRGE